MQRTGWGMWGRDHRVLLPFRSGPCLGLALLGPRGKKVRTFQDSTECPLRPTWFSASQSPNPASPTACLARGVCLRYGVREWSHRHLLPEAEHWNLESGSPVTLPHPEKSSNSDPSPKSMLSFFSGLHVIWAKYLTLCLQMIMHLFTWKIKNMCIVQYTHHEKVPLTFCPHSQVISKISPILPLWLISYAREFLSP